MHFRCELVGLDKGPLAESARIVANEVELLLGDMLHVSLATRIPMHELWQALRKRGTEDSRRKHDAQKAEWWHWESGYDRTVEVQKLRQEAPVDLGQTRHTTRSGTVYDVSDLPY